MTKSCELFSKVLIAYTNLEASGVYAKDPALSDTRRKKSKDKIMKVAKEMWESTLESMTQEMRDRLQDKIPLDWESIVKSKEPSTIEEKVLNFGHSKEVAQAVTEIRECSDVLEPLQKELLCFCLKWFRYLE